MPPRKACPIVLRPGDEGMHLLVFRHPLAGTQLVKGTVEPGESPAHAAVRELREESGLHGQIELELGPWDSGYRGQTWDLFLMRVDGDLPDAWEHNTVDDRGHTFAFYWHPLDAQPGDDWFPLFRRALDHIEQALRVHL